MFVVWLCYSSWVSHRGSKQTGCSQLFSSEDLVWAVGFLDGFGRCFLVTLVV